MAAAVLADSGAAYEKRGKAVKRAARCMRGGAIKARRRGFCGRVAAAYQRRGAKP